MHIDWEISKVHKDTHKDSLSILMHSKEEGWRLPVVSRQTCKLKYQFFKLPKHMCGSATSECPFQNNWRGLWDSPTWTQAGRPKQWALRSSQWIIISNCGKWKACKVRGRHAIGGELRLRCMRGKRTSCLNLTREVQQSSTSHKKVAHVPHFTSGHSAFAPKFVLSWGAPMVNLPF